MMGRALCLAVAGLFFVPTAAWGQAAAWDPVPAPPPTSPQGAPATIDADHLLAFTLDEAALKDRLADAPAAGLRGARSLAPVPSCSPCPPRTARCSGSSAESPVMEPELGGQAPGEQEYAGVASTIRRPPCAPTQPAGVPRLGPRGQGAWYIDPYYHPERERLRSYYGRDLVAEPDVTFVEPDPEVETDPANCGALPAPVGPEITAHVPARAPHRPEYAAYFGTPNVTAAKVTLINRVDQVYEDETAISMVLIGEDDKLNLDTAAKISGPNGRAAPPVLHGCGRRAPAPAPRRPANTSSTPMVGVPATTSDTS